MSRSLIYYLLISIKRLILARCLLLYILLDFRTSKNPWCVAGNHEKILTVMKKQMLLFFDRNFYFKDYKALQ